MTKPIDLEEIFPHLSKAPIVEAVIDIRITPKGDLDEKKVSSFLREKLPDYPTQKGMISKTLEIAVGKESKGPIVKDLGFMGSRVESTTEPYIAQFNKEAFVFSRLSPYNKWELFVSEAIRLWNLYCDLACPEEIQRIGVRFINKIDAIEGSVELENYYENSPASIKDTDWPILNYMHKDTYQPMASYMVNVIRTVKRGQDTSGAGLILDIDVIMNMRFRNDIELIMEHLVKMKWIKNKTFFNSIKPEVIERYK